jgi:hypothetical protein
MSMLNRTILLCSVLALPGLAAARSLQPLPGGYYKTGEGTRQKKVAFAKVDVYDITHSMKQVPSNPTREAIVDANVDKKFDWDMLRNVDGKRISNALRDAYKLNGYADDARVEKLVQPFQGGLKKGDHVQIWYDAASQTTSVVTPRGRATIPGHDFMKETWSIWFGKIDQPSLTQSLMSDLR